MSAKPHMIPLDTTLLRLIPVHDESATTITMLRDPHIAATACVHGWAMLDGGYVVGAGGLIPMWPGRAIAWILPSRDARPRHFVQLFRWAKGWLDEMQTQYRRIEASAVAGFGPGCRFLEHLGFRREGFMNEFAPDGADHILYARIKWPKPHSPS